MTRYSVPTVQLFYLKGSWSNFLISQLIIIGLRQGSGKGIILEQIFLRKPSDYEAQYSIYFSSV